MKKLIKSLTTSLLALTLVGAFVGCGQQAAPAETAETKENTELITLTVGATPVPHAEILESVKPLLKEKGIDLQIEVFTDYVLPNTALDSKELDANFFQHQPYLDDFNTKNSTNIASVAAIHFEPLGIYPGKSASLDSLQKGVSIAIPNDVTNEARALQLLARLELITIDESKGLAATITDITSNPYEIEFVELEAATIPRSLPDVDFGVINGNYALDAGIADTVLTSEEKDSEGATTFANILAVHADNVEDPSIALLIEALTSEETRTFIQETYGNIVVPVF